MHPRQPALDPPLLDILEAALVDAGYGDDEGILYVFDGEKSETGFEAFTYLRGDLVGAQEIPEVAPLRGELNHPDARSSIRIIVFTGGRSEEGTAALMRHELEHARQVAALGSDILGLYNLCYEVLKVRGGGLPGGGLLYTLMPIEMDANAASARFATARYGRERIVELLRNGDSSGSALRSNVGPEPIETLPERMVAFMIANRGLCELYADRYGNGLTFRQLLDAHWPRSGDSWRALVEDRGLALPR